MKKWMVALLFCMIFLSGCSGKNESTVIKNETKKIESDYIYRSYGLEIPYNRNTMDLDYIAEQCIGIIANKDGQIEMITLTRSVKEQFRDKAKKFIKQNKQLTPDMLECRVWKFCLNEEREWHREAVCQTSFVNEEEITKLNAQMVKFKPTYDREGNFVLFMQYTIKTEDGRSKYGIQAYQIKEKKWKMLGEYTYTENGENVEEPINMCMAENDNLFVSKMDGSIIKYNFSMEKIVDESTAFMADLSLSAFSNEYGFCKDNSKNEIIIFDIDGLIEEKRLSIPEISATGSEVMGANSESVVYYVNSLGIYRESMDETGLDKIFSANAFTGVSIEDMVYNYIGVSDKGDMIIHMYDPLDESTREYIYLIEKIEVDK